MVAIAAWALGLDPFRTDEENIDSFPLLIDLTNPSASQVLLCLLNLNGRQKKPHPGGDIFFGADDLNYQLLGFVYATENGATPLDFAFFVRKINPLFNDENGRTTARPHLRLGRLP